NFQDLRTGAGYPLFTIDGFAFAACQRSTGFGIQVLQQDGAPGIPEIRARRSDIADGHRVEVVEMNVAVETLRKFVDDDRVADVATLCRGRHHQMVLDQPRQQRRITLTQLMPAGELADLIRTEFGMIAAPTLGDVME